MKKGELEQGYIEVEVLIPYVNNAKIHSDEQITKIASSMKEFGVLAPIIVDNDNGIIAGHGRVMAAKKLGVEKMPFIRAESLTETQKKAYVLADNRLGEVGVEWDFDLVSVELEALQEMDFDIELTGFDLDDLGGDEEESMPVENNGIDYKEKLEVVIEVITEREQESIFNEMEKRGYKCRILSI